MGVGSWRVRTSPLAVPPQAVPAQPAFPPLFPPPTTTRVRCARRTPRPTPGWRRRWRRRWRGGAGGRRGEGRLHAAPASPIRPAASIFPLLSLPNQDLLLPFPSSLSPLSFSEADRAALSGPSAAALAALSKASALVKLVAEAAALELGPGASEALKRLAAWLEARRAEVEEEVRARARKGGGSFLMSEACPGERSCVGGWNERRGLRPLAFGAVEARAHTEPARPRPRSFLHPVESGREPVGVRIAKCNAS
jgi:hypothetical protein